MPKIQVTEINEVIKIHYKSSTCSLRLKCKQQKRRKLSRNLMWSNAMLAVALMWHNKLQYNSMQIFWN